jgi:hypothetical protein
MARKGCKQREDWKEIVNAINSVGKRNLKQYCTGKLHPVYDFDRDWEILRLTITGNTHYAIVRYNISRQRVNQILRRYWQYAIECKQELNTI